MQLGTNTSGLQHATNCAMHLWFGSLSTILALRKHDWLRVMQCLCNGILEAPFQEQKLCKGHAMAVLQAKQRCKAGKLSEFEQQQKRYLQQRLQLLQHGGIS